MLVHVITLGCSQKAVSAYNILQVSMYTVLQYHSAQHYITYFIAVTISCIYQQSQDVHTVLD